MSLVVGMKFKMGAVDKVSSKVRLSLLPLHTGKQVGCLLFIMLTPKKENFPAMTITSTFTNRHTVWHGALFSCALLNVVMKKGPDALAGEAPPFCRDHAPFLVNDQCFHLLAVRGIALQRPAN